MKQRTFFFLCLIIITIYCFVFPQRTGEELVILPHTLSHLEHEAPVKFDEKPEWGINIGQKALFLSGKGEIIASQEEEILAVDDNWLAVSDGSSMELREPYGRVRFSLKTPSIPYAKNACLFLVGAMKGSLAKVDPENGTILWEREFVSELTVLDTHANRSLIGLLDGRIFLIDDSGEILLEETPQGSRIQVIYGAALSQSGTKIAIISGLYPQRLVLMEERKNGFRPVFSRSTETDFRRRIPMSFIENDTLLLYESEDNAIVMQMENYKIQRMPLQGTDIQWTLADEEGALAILGKGRNHSILKIFSEHKLPLFEGRLPEDIQSMRFLGSQLYLIGDDRYAVYNMRFQ